MFALIQNDHHAFYSHTPGAATGGADAGVDADSADTAAGGGSSMGMMIDFKNFSACCPTPTASVRCFLYHGSSRLPFSWTRGILPKNSCDRSRSIATPRRPAERCVPRPCAHGPRRLIFVGLFEKHSIKASDLVT